METLYAPAAVKLKVLVKASESAALVTSPVAEHLP